MSKGYIVAEVFITDMDAYAASGYMPIAAAALEKYGGRYLVRGGDGVLLEGQPAPKRIVVVEFPSREAARQFYFSDDYAPAILLRQSVCETRSVLVSGYDS
jgi:uncharacterized protein (DUF1330 family)